MRMEELVQSVDLTQVLLNFLEMGASVLVQLLVQRWVLRLG